MMMISMGWEYISERRPPLGILLIPQVIHEHGGAMVEYLQRENSWFVHQNYLAILPAGWSSSKAGGIGEGNKFGLI